MSQRIMSAHQPYLFPPTIERKASIPVGTVFNFGGRPLYVVRVYGSDAAAPVIVEELTDNATFIKGQFALWSADGVSRVMRRRR